jgi:nicotinate-nucleotide pyrophosphorylase (carboxylating)
MIPLDPADYRELVRHAVAEDVGPGDLTSRLVVPTSARAQGSIIAKQSCVVAGLPIAAAVFAEVDPAIHCDARVADGTRVEADAVIAAVAGPAASILAAERVALNFLQHLSGIATLTRRFVNAAGGRVDVLDTRKTIPTWRPLAKYAVRCGGGKNHRMGLYDAILIKDNHIRLAGGIGPAVTLARAGAGSIPVEVETETLADVDAALAAGADIIMLDNFDDAGVRAAVSRIGGRAKVEVSGGVTLDRMPGLAALGVNFVSVGALTHSAPAADLSLELDEGAGSGSR